MPREESVIFRFVTEGKDKALRDFAEVESVAQRTAAAMGGGQQQPQPGQRQRGTQGGPWGVPAGQLTFGGMGGGAPHASLPPIGPAASSIKVDSALVNTIAQVVSETLRQAMTKGVQSVEQSISTQTQRQAGGSTFFSPPTEYLSPQQMQDRMRATGQTLSSQTSPEVLARIRAQQTGVAPQTALPPISPIVGGNGISQAGTYNIPVEMIRSDPENLQWRRGARGAGGTTGRLAGIRQFDRGQAGTIDVMRDPQGEGYVVIEGHHRTEALRTAIDEGWEQKGTTLQAQIHPFTSYQEARQYGAMKNILGGQGTPFEIASYIREQYGVGGGKQFLADPRLGRNVPNVQEGAALANLSENILGQYERGRLGLNRAVMLGNMELTPTAQERVYGDIQKFGKSRGRQLSDEEFDVYLRRAANAATTSEAQTDFFGQTQTRSLLNERVMVESGVLGRMRSSRTALSQLGRESLVAMGRQTGILSGDVNVSGARDMATQTAQAIEVVKSLANDTSTAVNKLLNLGAEQVAGGANLEEVITNITKQFAEPGFVQQMVKGTTAYDVSLPQAGAAGPVAPATTGTRSTARERRARQTEEEVAARRQQTAQNAGYESYEAYEAGMAEQRRQRIARSAALREEFERTYGNRTPEQEALATERTAGARAASAADQARRTAEYARQADELEAAYQSADPAGQRTMRAQGVPQMIAGLRGGYGGGGGGAPPAPPSDPFDTSGIPDDPNAGINAQRSRSMTSEGMQNIRGQDKRAAGANARLRRIEQRIAGAIETIEQLGGGQGSPAQVRRIQTGRTAAFTPDLGARGVFDPYTRQFTTTGTGVGVEELQNRLTTGLEQATGRGVFGQRRRAEEATARREGAAGNITALRPEDFEVRQARMRVLQQQMNVYRGRLDEAIVSGRGGQDPQVQRISAQLGQASEAYETLAKQGKMGFGVDQGGFVGALQKASFKAFPFTIGAFAVQSGTAPIAGAASQFQTAYQQTYAPTVADIESRERLTRAQARLGAQGATVTRGIQDFGATAFRALEPLGGGYAAAGGAAVGAVIGSGLNVAGLAIALREMAGGVRAATAGLGGLTGVARSVAGALGGLVGAGVGGAAQGAAGVAGQAAGAAVGGGVAGAAARGGLGALIAGAAAPAAIVGGAIAVGLGVGALGTGAGNRAVQGSPLQGISDFMYGATLQSPRGRVFGPGQQFGPEAPSRAALIRSQTPDFAAFEARYLEDQRLQEDPVAFARTQVRIREAQGDVSFSQFQRGQAQEALQDARTLARFDRQQGLDLQQIGVQADRQASALGRGYARQVRGAELSRDRATRQNMQQLADSFEDIGINEGRQLASAGRQFGRTIRDIGIGEGEGQQDIQRGLGRTLASIDRQGGRSREEIERNYGRGLQDIVLGQVGGIAGQFLQLGVGRARALEDLEREQGFAREDAQRSAGEAGEDLTTETGRARARARRGLGDTTEDIGIGAGEARADAGRAYDRGERSIGQQFEDTLADANQSYKDAMSDLTKATEEAISDRKQLGTTERENLEKELAERAAIRQQILDDMTFQRDTLRAINQNMTNQERIYEDWNKAIQTHTKAVNAAADNIKLGAARALTGS